jgi:hypothetical protein
MQKTKGKFITIFVTSLLLLSSLTAPALAWQNPCPPCHYWDGADCENECYPNLFCERCVAGECEPRCLSRDCEECDGQGGCFDGCILYEMCLKCDGNAWCESTCDPDKCEECVNNQCKVCGGNPDKVCCDGACWYKCIEEDDETSCSAVNNMPCIKCRGVLGDCSAYVTMQYTNAVRWDCTGGCPGDCDYVDPPICYRTYDCKDGIYYILSECKTPFPLPGPLDCYPTSMPWGCTTCVPNLAVIKYTGYTTSSRCQ